MRYQEVDKISFEHMNGKFATINDRYDIPTYTIAMNMPITKNEEIDEIATRDYIYGELAEGMAYKIFEANIEKIVDGDFTLRLLTTLGIPR